jgi:rhamnogalacturonyl hydrolase YesR
LNMLDRLIDWFLNSKIFDGESYLEYYTAKGKGLEYPEITAYAISLSCILHDRTKDDRFLERAETCAKYMNKISRNGGIPCFSDNLLYTFDTGILISSMFDLYALTGNEAHLKEAEKSLNWLHSLRIGKDFPAVNEIPEKREWYHLPSVHLVKLVIPLLKASKYLENKEYEITALDLLNRYKQFQSEDGYFRVNGESHEVMSHPHCYAIEGFLYAYHILKRRELLEMVQNASEWLCKVQNADGSFYQRYCKEKSAEQQQKIQKKLKTSDATAQATRIWKLLGTNQKGIEKAYAYLKNELHDNGLRLFKSTSLKSRFVSSRRPVYSWPTFFYLHSLALPFDKMEYCSELF